MHQITTSSLRTPCLRTSWITFVRQIYRKQPFSHIKSTRSVLEMIGSTTVAVKGINSSRTESQPENSIMRTKKHLDLIWHFLVLRSIVSAIFTTDDCPEKLCGIPPIAVCVVFGKMLVKCPGSFPPIAVLLVNDSSSVDASKEPIPVPEEKKES